jgi:hypothetical protein
VQLRIEPAGRQQSSVGAALGHVMVLHHKDPARGYFCWPELSHV